jgi:hypothetical protein
VWLRDRAPASNPNTTKKKGGRYWKKLGNIKIENLLQKNQKQQQKKPTINKIKIREKTHCRMARD